MLNYYESPETSTENFECFTSKPKTLGTFWNLHIKINYKMDISKTNIGLPIELKICMLSIFKV